MSFTPYPDAFLSGRQSFGLFVLATVFILVNGVLVILLKAAGAGLAAYGLVVPAAALALVFAVRALKAQDALPGRRQWAVLVALSAVGAGVHLLIYGTAYNSDAALHFAHAFHSFFVDKRFSFSEAPFITFGPQPVAKHWLPDTLEYPMTAVAWLGGLSFQRLTWLFHFLNDMLCIMALAGLVFRFVGALPGAVLTAMFLGIFYALIRDPQDIIGMSLFRGFEAKGLIFGFYYWAVAGLFMAPARRVAAMDLPGPLLAVVGLSTVFVSANFPVVAVIAAVLAGAACVAGAPVRSCAVAAAWFVGPVLAAAVVYRLLPGVDVMAHHTDALTPVATAYSPALLHMFAFSYKHWLVVAAIVALLALFDRPLAVQLGLYILVSLMVQSKWAFDLEARMLGPYQQVIWRFLILFNPFLPLVVGGAAIAGRLDRKMPVRLPLAGLAVVALGLFLRPPPGNQYVGAIRPVLNVLNRDCRPGVRVLAPPALAVLMPVISPSFSLLAGKHQYLNWQIGNLPPGSPDRRRALRLRKAIEFLSGWAAGEADFRAAVAAEAPDVVVVPAGPLSAATTRVLAAYRESSSSAPSPYVPGTTETYLIFSRPGACRRTAP